MSERVYAASLTGAIERYLDSKPPTNGATLALAAHMGRLHINQPLTSISVTWLGGPGWSMDNEVFPIVPVARSRDSGIIYKPSSFATPHPRAHRWYWRARQRAEVVSAFIMRQLFRIPMLKSAATEIVLDDNEGDWGW